MTLDFQHDSTLDRIKYHLDIFDVETGASLRGQHIIWADDKAGVYEKHKVDGKGWPIVAELPTPHVVKETIHRPIRFGFRESSPPAKRKGVERWLEKRRAASS